MGSSAVENSKHSSIQASIIASIGLLLPPFDSIIAAFASISLAAGLPQELAYKAITLDYTPLQAYPKSQTTRTRKTKRKSRRGGGRGGEKFSHSKQGSGQDTVSTAEGHGGVGSNRKRPWKREPERCYELPRHPPRTQTAPNVELPAAART